MYEIIIRRKALKNAEVMPMPIQNTLANLLEDLRTKGPVRKEWPNLAGLKKTLTIATWLING